MTTNVTTSTTTPHPLTQLQPTDLWTYFYQLTQIPRPSHHENAIQEFIMDFGQSLGLDSKKDHVGNIIIKKPATAGMEDAKGVILQSHLDMVPQANKDSSHNFVTDPIQAYIDPEQNNEWVTATGTTLGADNGIGVAAIMAILADDSIAHGNIEALFTSTEETGMVGAFGLQAGQLEGEILLNLDSEDEGELYVGCAGGIDVNGHLAVERMQVTESSNEDSASYATYQVTLNGLKGGHSGLDINKQRGNANKLLSRWLSKISQELNNVQLIDFNGGNLRNAIPREAEAIITLPAENVTHIEQSLNNFTQILNTEYQGVETNIKLTLTQVTSDRKPLTHDSKNKLLSLINASPNGVYRLSVSMEDLVETSCNLSVIDSLSDDTSIQIQSLIRGSLDSSKQQQADEIHSLFALCEGAEVGFSGEYPGWQPNLSSQVLQLMKETGKTVFGTTPDIKGIHAGLECGILAQNYPNWDMISFGPTIRGAHSPDEKVHIQSVASFYQWLLLTLTKIPKVSS